MSNCPVAPFSWEAISVVNDAHNALMPMGIETFETAKTFAQDLASFAAIPVDVNVSFSDVDPPDGPRRPERPEFPEDGLVFVPPGQPPDPPTFSSANPKFERAPDFTDEPYEPNYGEAPSPLGKTAPGPAPKLPERTAPEIPGYTLPCDPTLELITPPTKPKILIDPFDGIPPTGMDEGEFDRIIALIDSTRWTPEQYTSSLLDKIKSTIDWGLDGGIGLPAAVQDALWARARGRVDMEEARAIQQVVDEFGARGFTEANGILNQRIEMVRQNNQNQRLIHNRELIIEEAKLEIENLRFMVQQGIALEGTLIGMHMQFQQLTLEAARFLIDAALKVFEAKVSLVRLKYDVFTQQVQAYKAYVEAEISKVEIFKAEVEAEKALGEINEQRVRQYEAQVRAVGGLVAFFNAEVNAYIAQLQTDVQPLEAFKVQLQAYNAEVGAKVAEWNAYQTRVGAETAKVGTFDSLVRAYGARVAATSDYNRNEAERERIAMQQHEANLRTHTATLENIRVALAAEQARVQSVSAAFAAQAQVFSADAQVEQAVSAALDRRYGLDIQKATQAAQIALQNGQARVQENVQLSGLQLQALQAATQVLAQLSAGALSAVNYSAGIGYQQQGSVSCSTQNNYQY